MTLSTQKLNAPVPTSAMPPASATSVPVTPEPIERLPNENHYLIQTQTPSNLLVSSASIISMPFFIKGINFLISGKAPC